MAKTATAQKREPWEVELDGIETAIADLHDRVRRLREKLGRRDPVGDIRRGWASLWRRQYGDDYEFNRAKDGGQIKALIGSLGFDELGRRLRRYLADRDPWLVRQKHPLGYFYSNVNRYAETFAGPSDPEAPAPGGVASVEETKRRVEELRRAR